MEQGGLIHTTCDIGNQWSSTTESEVLYKRHVERMGELFEWLIVCGPDELLVKIGNLLLCFVA